MHEMQNVRLLQMIILKSQEEIEKIAQVVPYCGENA